MTTGETQKKRPGSALIGAGIVFGFVGLLIAIYATVQNGAFPVPWILIVGLLLAGIGFAVRLLAAVERR
ncbi:hypothetical protein [Zhihengliuella flava]|uniref:Protein-S-isoprenylcysteine O-methyltransferase Ste14 n=1 Tax=Zhihengliuella flava TaxID=1285193 RepID=A0A931D8X7_9MICC|nr:hypothetical protein [Zhihengliuella flava]MBG6085810.1 protein-S-isoprenylcysteine O-methyltransferase Ste14 [Zhihengliuella flava]